MNLLHVVIDQRLQNYVVALAKMSGKSISFLLFLYMPGDDNFIEKTSWPSVQTCNHVREFEASTTATIMQSMT